MKHYVGVCVLAKKQISREVV